VFHEPSKKGMGSAPCASYSVHMFAIVTLLIGLTVCTLLLVSYEQSREGKLQESVVDRISQKQQEEECAPFLQILAIPF
jgi:hypothetical protein